MNEPSEYEPTPEQAVRLYKMLEELHNFAQEIYNPNFIPEWERLVYDMTYQPRIWRDEINELTSGVDIYAVQPE